MKANHERDFVGYGRTPPAARWPNDARLALVVVLNVEEGAEPSIAAGDPATETALTDAIPGEVPSGTRDFVAESLFEYGSRVGFWRIIDLMAELCAAKGTAILMISHDLGLVANMCRRVAVMYAGRIVEAQPADAIFATPRHPYTQGLINSLPRLGERSRRGRQKLQEIAGTVPSIAAYPAGCRFNPRCSAATEVCLTVPPEATPLPADGIVRCHHHG